MIEVVIYIYTVIIIKSNKIIILLYKIVREILRVIQVSVLYYVA